MSTKQGRDQLKTYFETGDRPTEDEFSEFIDSGINQVDDTVHIAEVDGEKYMGVGRVDPTARLDVAGNINVSGHMFGRKAGMTDEDFLIVSNSAEIQLFGKNHPNRKGDLFLIGDKSENGLGKISFDQRITANQWRSNMLIDTNGNVGIGTNLTSAGNKLEIAVSSGNNTGLKLTYGAGLDKLLVSDANGNARWEQPTNLTNGFWTKNGNHIGNTNAGNVGVGTHSPVAKLDVNGNMSINNNTLLLRNGSDQYHGLGYYGTYSPINQLFANKHIDGPVLFGNNGGALAVKTPVNNVPVETIALKWDANLNVNVYGNLRINDKTLFFHSDDNHGIGWFGAGKQFATKNIDGPVTFGFAGGALGTKNNSNENIAMQWFNNQRVDFKGKVTVNGEAPFVVKYYLMKPGIRPSNAGNEELYPKIPNDPHNASPVNNSNCAFEITDYPPSEWNAIIGNFSFNHVPGDLYSGQISFWIEKSGPTWGGNSWRLTAVFPNSHDAQKMVTILFIRKEFML
jgi:hypothetical protein